MGSDHLHFKFGSFVTYLSVTGKVLTSVHFRDSVSPGGLEETLSSPWPLHNSAVSVNYLKAWSVT